MIAERPITASDAGLIEVTVPRKDVLRLTEEGQIARLRDCGERFYKEVTALGFRPRKGDETAIASEGFLVQSNIDPYAEQWSLWISADKDHRLERTIKWVVQTRSFKQGWVWRRGLYWDGEWQVGIEGLWGKGTSLKISSLGKSLGIEARDYKGLEPPVNFRGYGIKTITEETEYVGGASSTRWPLVIRYEYDPLQKIEAHYGKEVEVDGKPSGRVLRPGSLKMESCVTSGNHALEAPLPGYNDFREAARVAQQQDAELTEQLISALPQEIDGVAFIEGHFDQAVRGTEQMLEQLRASRYKSELIV